jgi:hypothetical protein
MSSLKMQNLLKTNVHVQECIESFDGPRPLQTVHVLASIWNPKWPQCIIVVNDMSGC